jgi:hypothetical protein
LQQVAAIDLGRQPRCHRKDEEVWTFFEIDLLWCALRAIPRLSSCPRAVKIRKS